jgi:hypothetical protein
MWHANDGTESVLKYESLKEKHVTFITVAFATDWQWSEKGADPFSSLLVVTRWGSI